MDILGTSTGQSYKYKSGIRSYHLNSELSYIPSESHSLNLGLFFNGFNINPSQISPLTENDLVQSINVTNDLGEEVGMYLDYTTSISKRIQVILGLRALSYKKLGVGSEYVFLENQPKQVSSIVDTLRYRNGEVAESFVSFEPRMAINFSLSKNSSIKASYQRLRQFIHQLNNSVALSPFSIWKSSNTNIRPQLSDQVAIGYFRNFNNNTFESSIEVYHRWNTDVIEYKKLC